MVKMPSENFVKQNFLVEKKRKGKPLFDIFSFLFLQQKNAFPLCIEETHCQKEIFFKFYRGKMAFLGYKISALIGAHWKKIS